MGFLGRRFGQAVAVVKGFATSSVYTLDDQYFLTTKEGWATTTGMDASGGSSTATYSDPTGQQWKAHKFTATGSLVIAAAASPDVPDGNAIEYLCVGGGGGTGASCPSCYGTGGGGAGALKSNVGDTMIAVTVNTYPITVGAGGAGGPAPPDQDGSVGTASVIAGPDITTITSGGGGGSMKSQGWPPTGSYPTGTGGNPVADGGSGSGGSSYPAIAPGQTSTGDPGHPGGVDVASPANGWGNDGAAPYSPDSWPGGDSAAGGGGAATAGTASFRPGPPQAEGRSNAGPGGAGAAYTLVGGPTAPVYYSGGGGGGTSAGGAPNAPNQGIGGNSPTTKGGGGTGSGYHGPPGSSGSPVLNIGEAGEANTGGGAGGQNEGRSGVRDGLAGGSGIVVIRYKYPA